MKTIFENRPSVMPPGLSFNVLTSAVYWNNRRYLRRFGTFRVDTREDAIRLRRWLRNPENNWLFPQFSKAGDAYLVYADSLVRKTDPTHKGKTH